MLANTAPSAALAVIIVLIDYHIALNIVTENVIVIH
jgi:hypothetical protein